MAIDKEKLKDGLKTAFNAGVGFVKEATPYVTEGLKLAGQVANSLLGNGSSGGSNNRNNATYTPSNQAQQYQKQMNNLQKPAQQNTQWQQQLNDTMNAILNREKFSYDLNGDALFQQYEDQYTLGGQMAAQDVMGQAAAMTGGYGNSYAQTVAQQQYQGYLQQLNDKIPELYQLALDAHNQETADLYNRYGMLADAEAQEYARYRDQMSDYYAERDYLANQYYNERDFDYGKYVDDRNYEYQLGRDAVADEQWQKQYDRGVLESDREYAYQLARDAVSDKRYDTEWQYQLDRDAIEDGRYDQQWQYQLDRDAISDKRYDTEWQHQLDRDKVSDSQWQKTFDESIRQYNASLAEDKRQANLNYDLSNKKISGSGGSNSGGTTSKESNSQNKGNGWDNGKLTSEQVKELQKHLGVTADGKWGEGSSAKAGGKSADEAWSAYENNKLGTMDYSKINTYEDAVKFLKDNKKSFGTMMTKEEWARRKASYKKTGTGPEEVSEYDTYGDYLRSYCQYYMEV